MAKKESQQPFNLLYRFEPQKSNVDKVYEFVVFQGRIIVMGVMLLIILAFAYRFPLDKKLNDQINLSNDNLKRLDYYASDELEQKYNDTYARAEAAEKFLNLYKNTDTKIKSDRNQTKLSDSLKLITDINKNSFKDDIAISDYTFSSDPKSETSLILNGYVSKFPTVEDFREEILAESKEVSDIKMQNLGGAQRGDIQFSMEIKFK